MPGTVLGPDRVGWYTAVNKTDMVPSLMKLAF